jgi:DNA repair exonuclease SbcCD nuclease subunit
MKIAIFSDWHLGLNWGTELEMDSFIHLQQALDQIEQENIDLILCAGDLFDKTIPSHEVYFEAIKILNNTNIENKIKLKNSQNLILKIPMISIIGNHEFRGKDYKSTVELLEVMGFLKVLHAQDITIDNITIFGLGGVPDKYALDIIKKWNPIPIKNNYNILMIHQSFSEYLPIDSQEVLSLSNLPSGFDLIINGHLHWNTIVDLDQGGKFLMPGSTVSTQNKKLEANKPKGYYILNTNKNQFTFKEIKNTRPIFYIDLSFKQVTIPEVKEKIINKINEIKNKQFSKKPLVRIKIKGELKEGYFAKDINILEIEKQFPNLYLSFSNKLEEKSLKESVEKLKELQQSKESLKDISKEIFFEQIKQTQITKDFDYQRLFDILYKGDYEKAKELLLLENEK